MCGGSGRLDSGLLKGFYIEDVLIEPAKGQVTGPHHSKHIQSKAAEVLLCLASNPGKVVSRADLIECAWGKGYGSEEALTHAISELRHALDDHADEPRFIQTLPRHGYRLLARPVPGGENDRTIVLGVNDGGGVEALNLFHSLNRRGVFETALAYMVFGWFLIQVADIVFDQLHFPQWVATFVTVLVIAGFPIAIVLSWFLEIRDGRAILDRVSPQDERRRRFGRTYISVIGGLAIASAFVFVYDQSVGLPNEEIIEELVERAPPEPPSVRDNSIAVLPFVNIDGSDETEIFANGLVDDVITRLTRVPGLLVSSRGDSFTLSGNSASSVVREQLRVATYLEGSVERADDRLRVIVQMIDSETGFHILSRRFDRPRTDFFDIRDEITALTVANVRVALPLEKGDLSLQAYEDPALDAYLLYRRGIDATRSALSMDNFNEALRWFDEALTLDPEYAAAHAGKCVAYVSAFGEIHDTSLIDRAKSACSSALQLNTNLAIVHAALGKLGVSTGNYEDAENSFKRALEIDPSSAQAFMGLGEVYSATNRPADAESSLQQAIGLHPGASTPHINLGNFLYHQGRYDEAAQQYQYAVALDRTNSNAYSNLGAAYMLSGDFTAAQPAFQKSLEIDPKATTYFNLGLLHYYLGHFGESIANHRQAVALEPNDYLSRSNLGDALWVSGDRDGAQEVFEEALLLAEGAFDINPNDPLTMMDMAWMHAMLDETDEAAALMAKARVLAPLNPYTHYYDGLIRFRSGNVEGAISSLRRAVKIGYPVALLGAEPHLQTLHADPRFLQILSAH